MGTTDHLLKSIQEQREGKKRGTVPEGDCPRDSNPRHSEPEGRRISSSHHWRFFSILIFAILLSILINIALFITTANNSKKSAGVTAKINELKQAVNNNNRALSEKISQFDSKIKEVENNQTAQTFAIENLKKAKDNVFSRVSNLEAKTETTNKVVKVEEAGPN